jgi:uncharacterized membrane protein SpoIIM required for sporulation
MKIFSFWTKASQKRKRIYSIVFVFLVALLATVIGTLIPLSSQDAYTLSNTLNQTLNQNKANNTLTQYIFVNNFTICLLMFIPIAGAALGLYILFNTGVALGAIATTQGYPVWIGLGSLLLTPVFWLEFAAYSIAMAESIWLFRRLTQKRLGELKWTGVFIAVCAGLLAAGAVVEVFIISAAG